MITNAINESNANSNDDCHSSNDFERNSTVVKDDDDDDEVKLMIDECKDNIIRIKDDGKEYSSDYEDYFMDDEVYKLLDDELENGVVTTSSATTQQFDVLNKDKNNQLQEKFKGKLMIKHNSYRFFMSLSFLQIYLNLQILKIKLL